MFSFLSKLGSFFNQPKEDRVLHYPQGRRILWGDPYTCRTELLNNLSAHAGDSKLMPCICNADDEADWVQFNPAAAVGDQAQTLGQILVPAANNTQEDYASPCMSYEQLESWLERFEAGESIQTLCQGEHWYRV